MEAKPIVFAVIIAVMVMVTIVIGLKVYYSVATTDELGAISETFTMTNTTYGITTNVSTTLQYPPNSASDFVCMYYNNETATWNTSVSGTGIGKFVRSGATFRFNGTRTTAPLHQNITNVNVTYYTQSGVQMRDSVNPQAAGVFNLAPIIGLVLIASVIIGVIVVSVNGRRP